MKHLYTYVSIFLVFILSSVGAQAKGANYTAHEWGTFTSLVGSNGRTVNGMYHEDEPLPSFVHGFGELVSQPIFQPDPGDECRFSKIPCEFLRRNSVTQKMETPVIYFYSKENQALDVTVDVKFPTGAVTETFPGPTFTTPRRGDAPVLANGHTIFNVQVYPMNQTPTDVRIPLVEPGNIYGHARQVHSSYVRAQNELEKFIFYRGVGQFQPELNVTSRAGNLRIDHGSEVSRMLLLDVAANGSVRAVDLMQFPSKRGTLIGARDIAQLRAHESPLPSHILDRKLAFAHIRDNMLVPSGLTLDEAQAMIDTWENGYLSVPGLRLLYILPSHEVHRLLPLELTPAPADVVRVFVGRLEVMLDTDEVDLMNKVIAAGDLIDVAQLGRFAESRLHRTLEVYLNQSELSPTGPNPDVVESFNRLIARAKSLEFVP